MFAVRSSQFAVRSSQFAVRSSQFAVRSSQFAVRSSQINDLLPIWFITKKDKEEDRLCAARTTQKRS